jgi:septum formation protein
VKKQHGKAIVIGCDQVCAFGERALDKPDSPAAAIALLQQLQGKEHMLITAVTVQKGKESEEFVDVAMLRMRELKAAEIKRYVEQDQPVGCAGGYKFERAGIALFERVQGEDHTAIVGLPLLKLSAALRKFGLQVP